MNRLQKWLLLIALWIGGIIIVTALEAENLTPLVSGLVVALGFGIKPKTKGSDNEKSEEVNLKDSKINDKGE